MRPMPAVKAEAGRNGAGSQARQEGLAVGDGHGGHPHADVEHGAPGRGQELLEPFHGWDRHLLELGHALRTGPALRQERLVVLVPPHPGAVEHGRRLEDRGGGLGRHHGELAPALLDQGLDTWGKPDDTVDDDTETGRHRHLPCRLVQRRVHGERAPQDERHGGELPHGLMPVLNVGSDSFRRVHGYPDRPSRRCTVAQRAARRPFMKATNSGKAAYSCSSSPHISSKQGCRITCEIEPFHTLQVRLSTRPRPASHHSSEHRLMWS